MSQIEKRKRDHLKHFRNGEVPSRSRTTWLECVEFVHDSLPELSLNDIDLSTTFAGRKFPVPLTITGMTGGTEEAGEINRALARCAQDFGMGFGVGSQRAMIDHPELIDSYRVKQDAPNVFLMGNIGGVQLANRSLDDIAAALEAIEADALCVHLNPAQELAQFEGDRDFSGICHALAEAVTNLEIPIIAKETGAGIGLKTAVKLQETGVRYIDVSGVGGTSWVGVELLRRGLENDPAFNCFWDWGLPTAAAIVEASSVNGVEVMASGGIRTGLDMARALALGATTCGIAAPALRAWFEGGEKELYNTIENLLSGLKTTLCLCACKNLDELRRAPKIVHSDLKKWLEQRGIRPKSLSYLGME